MIGIYIIRCISNNKVYIGQSVNLKHRLNEHKRNLRSGIHINKHLQKAFNKYGEKEFAFDVLEVLQEEEYNKEKLDLLEIEYISKFESNNRNKGFNIENGGNGIGKIAEETKKKLSVAMKGNHNNADAWLGKHHSEETKKLISKRLKGKPSHWKGKKQNAKHTEKRISHQFGKVWVNNGADSRFVTASEADKLISLGYVYGRPFKNRIKGKKYLYNGEFYTIPQISKICNIDKHILSERIRLGWDIEKATTTPKTDNKYGKYLYNGEYLSLTYISKLVNIDYETLRSRMRRGLSLEEAIIKPIKRRK